MSQVRFLSDIQSRLDAIKEAGLYKAERVIVSPQAPMVRLESGAEALNLCANNYLGLANNPRLIEAARNSYDAQGYGMASVRFICGTQRVHRDLEQALAAFLRQEDAVLYSSCFDANTGLFETLLDEEDAIVSDELNHASIIDGVRLCKARRYRYANNNIDDLETQLKAARAAGARHILIATDGVFSMDGVIANLPAIRALADRYQALLMVDDSHAVGFMGANGRGTPEYFELDRRIDILTGTLGKALGGASGGYIAAARPVIELLRQRSRPYLFSNALAPSIAAASLRVLELLGGDEGDRLRRAVHENGQRFRRGLESLGFTLVPGGHPIIPVMLGDARLASDMACQLLDEGVYVTGFSYPVVPQGQARIRTQMSAAHTPAQIDEAIKAFGVVGRALGVVKG